MLTSEWNSGPNKRGVGRQGWGSGEGANVSGNVLREEFSGSQFPDR